MRRFETKQRVSCLYLNRSSLLAKGHLFLGDSLEDRGHISEPREFTCHIRLVIAEEL